MSDAAEFLARGYRPYVEMPLRAVVKPEVCISIAGAVAWSHLDCGHVLRFAGIKAMGTQGTRQRRCHICPRLEPEQGELFG